MNEKTISALLLEIKVRERSNLRNSVITYGRRVKKGWEYHFDDECPIIASYHHNEPCDVVILSVRVNKDGALIIRGDEKLDRGNEFELDPDNIFAGQLEYVTSNILVK